MNDDNTYEAERDAAFAREFGVTETTIRGAFYAKTWKHVPHLSREALKETDSGGEK